MNHFELFDELTDIDDDLILEAHEVPVSRRPYARLGGLRRAVVVIAAVMALVVTVVAAGGDLGVVSPIVRYHSSHYWYESSHMEQSDTVHVNGTDYSYHIYTTHSPDRAVASMRLASGETLEVTYEAEILMPDGTVERKTVTKQGTDRVIVFMTNEVEGESGTILKTRVSFVRITADGGRKTLGAWREALSEMFFENAPEGYSRDWPEETESPTEIQTILPEGSDVVVVIPGPDE